MKSAFGLAIAMVVGAVAGVAAKQVVTPRSTYSDTQYGFTLQAPKFPKAPLKSGAIPVTFQAPPDGAFAPNVNVMVQAVKTTRKEYQQLTAEQFKQVGVTVRSEKVRKVGGKEAIEWDYENEVQGNALRFLQLAVIDTDRVLLATCTAPADKFAKYEPEFRASLGSLKLTGRK
jgi:hypothetical protein